MKKNRFVVIESTPGKSHKGVVAAVILLVVSLGILLIWTQCKIKSITVSGNKHYTDGEMIAELKSHGYIDNSLLYMLKCKFKPPEDIPFVESMDVEVTNRNKISVTIYEKTMAGCIENMGDYMYFDKDGIVLESSQKKFDDVPLIKGLNFETAMVNEKLPFKDKKTVKQILNITQQIRKYKLQVRTVKFDNEQVYLYTDNITVALGSPDSVDEKIAQLPNMFDKAGERKGTLHMENYSLNSGVAYFDPK